MLLKFLNGKYLWTTSTYIIDNNNLGVTMYIQFTKYGVKLHYNLLSLTFVFVFLAFLGSPAGCLELYGY